MRSKRRAVQAALFAMEEGTVREIASVAGCTRQTTRRHLANLEGEDMATLRHEIGRGLRSWWVNVWFLTEKGSEVLGALKIIEEDVEHMILSGVPAGADAGDLPHRGLDPYITTGSRE